MANALFRRFATTYANKLAHASGGPITLKRALSEEAYKDLLAQVPKVCSSRLQGAGPYMALIRKFIGDQIFVDQEAAYKDDLTHDTNHAYLLTDARTADDQPTVLVIISQDKEDGKYTASANIIVACTDAQAKKVNVIATAIAAAKDIPGFKLYISPADYSAFKDPNSAKIPGYKKATTKANQKVQADLYAQAASLFDTGKLQTHYRNLGFDIDHENDGEMPVLVYTVPPEKVIPPKPKVAKPTAVKVRKPAVDKPSGVQGKFSKKKPEKFTRRNKDEKVMRRNKDGSLRKIARHHPGIVALREIRMYQKQTKLVSQFAPFVRAAKAAQHSKNVDVRYKRSALHDLHEALEAHIVRVLESVNLLAIHGKRVTIMPKDIDMYTQVTQVMGVQLGM